MPDRDRIAFIEYRYIYIFIYILFLAELAALTYKQQK